MELKFKSIFSEKEKSKKKKEISERIQGKIEEIKFKIKEILECEKERMREKTEKS